MARILERSLLRLIGQGFLGDPFAADGANLRWYPDWRLGLPRRPFIVERRPSVLGPQGLDGLALAADAVADMVDAGGDVLVGEYVSIRFEQRAPWSPTVAATVELGGGRNPLPAAICLARVTLGPSTQLQPPMLTVRAITRERGRDHRVVVAEASSRRMPPVSVTVAWPAIDALELEVDGADLELIELLDVATLDADPGWGNANPIPIATATHLAFMPFQPAVDAYARRIVAAAGLHGPKARHPLDGLPTHDPGQATPAASDDVEARYITPWLGRLEHDVARLLHDTLARAGTRLHQSEIADEHALTHFGQTAITDGGSVPAELAGATVTTAILPGLLLAAFADFQLAKLLGLACVPEERILAGEVWDFRVIGRWELDDLATWPAALERRMDAAVAAAKVPGLDATRKDELALELGALSAEHAAAVGLVGALGAAAGATPEVELGAFWLGLTAGPRPPYAPPLGLSARSRGSAGPGQGVGVVDLAWDLRERRFADDERSAPAAAAAARLGGGADDFLNAASPDPAAGGVRQPFVAADAPVLSDRAAPLNLPLTYWVSESDPFGRWSPAVTATTTVVHRAPPPSVGCEATAAPAPQSGWTLSCFFHWDPRRKLEGVAAGLPEMTFAIHVRRTPPPAGALRDRGEWGQCARRAGGTSGPFTFRGDAAPLGTPHDGMDVAVDVANVEVDGARVKRFGVHFHDIELAWSDAGVASAWVAVSTSHASEGDSVDVGVPARAEHIPTTPPTPPAMPPDPLLASLADAEDRSTIAIPFTVPDDGAATATRFQVLAAGERAVVDAANRAAAGFPAGSPQDMEHTAASSALAAAGASLALRAAALKRLAVYAEDVFELAGVVAVDPGQPAAGQALRAPVELPGWRSTLTLYTLRGRSAIGNASPWPAAASGFAVVAVPRAEVPSPPSIVRAENVPAGGGDELARLTVAAPPPGTTAVAAYEIYRTRDAAHARRGDARLFALVGTVPVGPGFWPAKPAPQVAALDDAGVLQDERYWYTVVARAAGARGGAAARSRASAVMQVDIRDVPTWTPLPPLPTGPAVSTPAIAVTTDAAVHVMVRADDGSLYHTVVEGGVRTWEAPPTLAGIKAAFSPALSSPPLPPPAGHGRWPPPPRLEAAFVDDQGDLRHGVLSPSGWGTFARLSAPPGPPRGAPAITHIGTDLHLTYPAGMVFASLEYSTLTAGAWRAWESVGSLAPTGEPAISGAPGSPFIAVRDASGLVLAERSAGAWTARHAPAADLRSMRPSLLASATGVAVAAQDLDRALVELPVLPSVGAWSAVERHPPGVVAVAVGALGSLHFVAVDPEGIVWYRRR